MLKRVIFYLLIAATLALGGCNKKELEEVSVPIVLYHHLDETGEGDSTIKTETFRSHIAALSAGYTAITFNQLIDFANGKASLPEKPVIITFDDGYESVYELAYPVLKEFDMHATVFVIGVSAGKDSYKDTGKPMLPHFGWDKAQEMIDSGLVSIQTHTFDMHQVTFYDGEDCRKGAQRLPDETDEEYKAAFAADVSHAKADIEQNTTESVCVMAYPFGLKDELSDELNKELGIEVTLTTIAEGNTVIKGRPEELYSLNRFSIDDISAQELLELIG